MTTTTQTVMTQYDDTLSDDACELAVLRAREAGRAWADREWDALSEEAMAEQAGESWYPSAVDARSLVDDDNDDHELADICNAAAAERWHHLTAGYRSRHVL